MQKALGEVSPVKTGYSTREAQHKGEHRAFKVESQAYSDGTGHVMSNYRNSAIKQ
jgi:hypothetical protein